MSNGFMQHLTGASLFHREPKIAYCGQPKTRIQPSVVCSSLIVVMKFVVDAVM